MRFIEFFLDMLMSVGRKCKTSKISAAGVRVAEVEAEPFMANLTVIEIFNFFQTTLATLAALAQQK